jgi:hypothetical protein
MIFAVYALSFRRASEARQEESASLPGIATTVLGSGDKFHSSPHNLNEEIHSPLVTSNLAPHSRFISY